jgi:hypothetical protein
MDRTFEENTMKIKIIIYETENRIALERVYEKAQTVPNVGDRLGVFIPGGEDVVGVVTMLIHWPNGAETDVFVQMSAGTIASFMQFDSENWYRPQDAYILEYLLNTDFPATPPST